MCDLITSRDTTGDILTESAREKKLHAIPTTANLSGRTKGDCEAESEHYISLSISWCE